MLKLRKNVALKNKKNKIIITVFSVFVICSLLLVGNMVSFVDEAAAGAVVFGSSNGGATRQVWESDESGYAVWQAVKYLNETGTDYIIDTVKITNPSGANATVQLYSAADNGGVPDWDNKVDQGTDYAAMSSDFTWTGKSIALNDTYAVWIIVGTVSTSSPLNDDNVNLGYSGGGSPSFLAGVTTESYYSKSKASPGDSWTNNGMGTPAWKEVSGTVANTAPTVSIDSVEAMASSSSVGMDLIFDDADDDDTLQGKVEYKLGTDCSSGTSDPTMDETDGSTTSTYGDPDVENDNTYQVGDTGAYITTSSGANTVSTDWLGGTDSLSPNVQYCIKVTPYDGTIAGTAVTDDFYSSANAPGTPTTSSMTTVGGDVTIAENSNPSSTEYLINLDGTALYVQANGIPGGSEVWQTNATWGAVTVTGASANTQYIFNVKARNAEDVTTAYTPSAAVYTLANAPGTATLSNVTATEMTVVIDVNSNPAGTDFAIYDTTTSKYVTAGGLLTSDTAVWQTYAEWGSGSGTAITGLAPGSTHSIQVKAINGDLVETALSTAASSQTLVAWTAESDDDSVAEDDETSNAEEDITEDGNTDSTEDEEGTEAGDETTEDGTVEEEILEEELDDETVQDNGLTEMSQARFDILAAKSITRKQERDVEEIVYEGRDGLSEIIARERLGLAEDFYTVYGRVPDKTDVHKLVSMLNTERPGERNLEQEKKALTAFIQVYGRLVDFSNPQEHAFIDYLAYMMRPQGRDIEEEKMALAKYVYIYKQLPDTGWAWSIIRSIAYGGVR